jgi:hypothetical protein
MARFQAAAAFAPDAATELQLLPLRFERLGANRFLVANLIGDLLLLNGEELDRVVSLAIAPGDGLYLGALLDAAATSQGVTDDGAEILSVPVRLRRAGREIRMVIEFGAKMRALPA